MVHCVNRDCAANVAGASLLTVGSQPKVTGMGLLSDLFGKKEPPLHIDDSNFEEEVLRSDVPVILDIWSPNCGPCKQLEDVMFGLRKQYDGRVKVCEANSRAALKVAGSLRITATPTVVYFDKGREKERVIGFRSSLYHQEAIEEVFGIAKKAPK